MTPYIFKQGYNITNDRTITICDVRCGMRSTRDVQACTPIQCDKAVDDVLYSFTLVMSLKGNTLFKSESITLVHSNNEAHNI
jgi:hypothetical protein